MRETPISGITENVEWLVDRAAGGDAASFGRLYDLFIDRIYRHIYYRVGSKQDAEDLTQQVFLRAWKAIGRYKKTTSPFPAWLMTISHNLIVDFYRSRKDRASLDGDLSLLTSIPGPEHIAEVHFDQQELRRAILRLPYEQQQVVLMSFIEGFSYSEIAASLGKSEGAVRVIMHRALKKMRQTLEPGKVTE